MHRSFRKRLIEGELLVGTGISLGSPVVPELLAELGFDWLFIDAEHAPLEFSVIQTLLLASGPNCPGVVRLPDQEELSVKKALDIGAAGIVVPQVNTAEQARKMVGFAKYPPEGTRGVGLARSNRYGIQFKSSVESANHDTAVILQAEHKTSIQNIEEIVMVEGVDAILVGPYDLSASYGKPGQINDPEVSDAIDTVAAACIKAGIKLGIFGSNSEFLTYHKSKGFTLLVAGMDVNFLVKAGEEMLTKLRQPQ